MNAVLGVRKLHIFLTADATFFLDRDSHAAHPQTSFGLTPRAATERRSVGDRYTGNGNGTRGMSGMNGLDQVEVRCDFGLRHQFECVSEKRAENHVVGRFELVVADGSLCTWKYSRHQRVV